jgi:hypothetical protein
MAYCKSYHWRGHKYINNKCSCGEIKNIQKLSPVDDKEALANYFRNQLLLRTHRASWFSYNSNWTKPVFYVVMLSVGIVLLVSIIPKAVNMMFLGLTIQDNITSNASANTTSVINNTPIFPTWLFTLIVCLAVAVFIGNLFKPGNY